MAAVDVVNGEQILIQVGDGQATEAFTHPCLINTERGIQFSAETTSTPVPDCADPSAPAWNVTEKSSLGCTITGSGLLDVASIEEYDAWFNSKDTKNVKAKVNKTGGSTWTGAFHLTEFSVSGNRKEKATCSITLVSSGAVVRSDNA